MLVVGKNVVDEEGVNIDFDSDSVVQGFSQKHCL